MAELEMACCSPEEQASCCDPAEKANCCGQEHGPGCGCAAGSDPVRSVPEHAGPAISRALKPIT